MRSLFLLICSLLVLTVPVAAQSSDLTYGTTVTGDTDTQYQFNANAGDLVNVQAIGLSAGFTPVLTLLDTSQHQAAQSSGDPLALGSTTLDYTIPLSGKYTLDVGSLDGGTGHFVLTLAGSPIIPPRALAQGTSAVSVSTTARVYQFSAPAELHITPAKPNLDFSAIVRDPAGAIAAELDSVPQASFAFDASGGFELILQAPSAGSVSVVYKERPDLAPNSQSSNSTSKATPFPIEAMPTPVGPLPVATATPVTAATAATAEATAQLSTLTAPNDVDFQIVIPANGHADMSDFVSYPQGDHQDRVAYSVSGLQKGATAQLQLTLNCSGTGTTSIDVTADQQEYRCGDTVVNRTVTATDNSGTVLIAATGGKDTYVQWTLDGTAMPVKAQGGS